MAISGLVQSANTRTRPKSRFPIAMSTIQLTLARDGDQTA